MPTRPLLLVTALGVAVVMAACDASEGAQDGLDPEVVESLQAVVDRSAEGATAGTLVRVDTPDGAAELVAGPSDLRTGAELTPGAAFRVASITKIATATVILQLVEEDALDLDGDVFEIIPHRAEDFSLDVAVTARQLLSHTGYHAPDALGISVPGQTGPVDVTELHEPYWAAGDLVATAEDLTTLARGVLTGALFDDDASLEAMLEPTEHNPAYALGVHRDDEDALGHGGLAAGYHSELRFHPDLDTVVVVLVNESAGGAAAEVQAQVSRVLREPR